MGFEFLREIPRSGIMDLKVFFIDTIKFASLLYYSEPLTVAIPVLCKWIHGCQRRGWAEGVTKTKIMKNPCGNPLNCKLTF